MQPNKPGGSVACRGQDRTHAARACVPGSPAKPSAVARLPNVDHLNVLLLLKTTKNWLNVQNVKPKLHSEK